MSRAYRLWATSLLLLIMPAMASLAPQVNASSRNAYAGFMDANDCYMESCPDRILLRRFLESQYVPEVGLLRAAVHAYPDNITIYIANDNVLAARALEALGSRLGYRIRLVLARGYSGGWNDKVDVLLGRRISDVFYKPLYELLGVSHGYRIVYEKQDPRRPIPDWRDYADLVVYHALNSLLEGRRIQALEAFINLTMMWDGYGFYDAAVAGVEELTGERRYQVYKCALFIFLYRAMEYAGFDVVYGYRDIVSACSRIIERAQDPVYGGIHTDYVVENGRIKPCGDVNTETTSMVALALYSRYPIDIGSIAKIVEPPSIGYPVSPRDLLAFTLVATACTMLRLLFLRRIGGLGR